MKKRLIYHCNAKVWTVFCVLISATIITTALCIYFINDGNDYRHSSASSSLNSVWRWECQNDACQKVEITPETEETAFSLPACRLFCSQSAGIWPKPTGEVTMGNYLAQVNVNSIDVVGYKSGTTPITELATAAEQIFLDTIKASIPSNVIPDGGKSLLVTLDIQNPNISRLTLETDESYTIKVNESADGTISALITAPTFFGARHGLETLNQIIIFDDLRNQIQIIRDISVADGPAYPHRGILLDTARNYMNVDALKRTLRGMGASKLNTFHWHITDSHSFPYVSKTRPEMSKYGAYSPSKIYSADDIKDLIDYATALGVKIIPEFDAPAHVGEGWQNTTFVTCFKWQPWQSYCVEPPCGQFDPTQDGLYDAVGELYGDMLEQFQPDVFHMGGDEVNFGCWNSTKSIVDWMATQGWDASEQGFIKLWNYFQSKALEKLYEKAGTEMQAIMWTSTLTQREYLLESLPKDKYIIQIWTKGDDQQVSNLLQNGYRVILSNYDAMYLDCGFGAWVSSGNNWCSPYIGWQAVYENKPAKIAGSNKNLVLGSEVALWSEQADSAAVDSRLWPRAAAAAEVFWTEPTTTWEQAEERMLVQRERLIMLGIDADSLQPEWCLHHEEHCRIGSLFNKIPNTNNNH